MSPKTLRAFGKFVLRQYLPAIEALCDEPANFANIIKAGYAYHRLMRDGGLLNKLTNQHEGSPIGGSRENHLEYLTDVETNNLRLFLRVLNDPDKYLANRNLTEHQALCALRVIDPNTDAETASKLSIGQLLATRPQIIMTTFNLLFHSCPETR
ncbi:MAG: hypothetical protein V1738_04810 [Patescibacteria group bacterium]